MTATDGGSPTTGQGTGGRPLGSAYVVHEVIGRGATGEVWRGVDRRTGAPVAVKVLRDVFADDPRVVERFLRERSMLSELESPNIVRLRDLVVEGDTVALVTDLVAGGDLRARLRRDGTLTPSLAVALTCQILEGLDVAHQHGVVHRDLKPENVLLEDGDDAPVVRITDFGIATLAYSSTSTVTTSIVGSPEYLAPEVIELGAVTPAVDLYSAGVVLYELLAGRTPFAGGPPIVVVRRQVDDPPPRIPGLPVALWSEIASLLAKDPAARPARARTAAKRLAELADELDDLPALARGLGEPGVVDLVAVEAAEAAEARNGDHGRLLRAESQTTRVRGRKVVDEVVHRAPDAPRRLGRRAWQRVAPLLAAGVVLVGIGGVWLARDASGHAPAVQYTAPPVLQTDTVVTRTLALSGSKGDHLAVRLGVHNVSTSRITEVLEPVIGVHGVTSQLHPYHVALGPGDTTTVSYTATIPHGDVDVARLTALDAQLDANVGNVLSVAHVTPGVLRLRPLERAYLNLSGALRNGPLRGRDDLHDLLSSIAWHSSDARVADVVDAAGSEWRPVVVASHPGRAVLHADVGTQSLDVEVVVSGSAASATDAPCEPGVGDPPGLTTIPEGTTIIDPGDHAWIVAGGARIPVRNSDTYARLYTASDPIEHIDTTELGAISTIPRDGTVFQVGDQYRAVFAGAQLVVTKQTADALAAKQVKAAADWLSDIPAYPLGPLAPRDGTLVTDFARTKTEVWHDDAWRITTRACPSANVARLPQGVAPPAASAQ